MSICFTISGNQKYQKMSLCFVCSLSFQGQEPLKELEWAMCTHPHWHCCFVLHGETQKEKASHGAILFHSSEIIKVTPSCPNFMPARSYLSLPPPNRYFCFVNASGIVYDLDHGSKVNLEDPSEPCKDSRCKEATLNPSLI